MCEVYRVQFLFVFPHHLNLSIQTNSKNPLRPVFFHLCEVNQQQRQRQQSLLLLSCCVSAAVLAPSNEEQQLKAGSRLLDRGGGGNLCPQCLSKFLASCRVTARLSTRWKTIPSRISRCCYPLTSWCSSLSPSFTHSTSLSTNHFLWLCWLNFPPQSDWTHTLTLIKSDGQVISTSKS